MGIWRNIGKIVILLFQIVHEQVKWYIGSWKRVPTKKSNPLNEISKMKKNEIIDRYNEEQESLERYNEEQESRERSKLMVDLCEQPHYSTTSTKHEPE